MLSPVRTLIWVPSEQTLNSMGQVWTLGPCGELALWVRLPALHKGSTHVSKPQHLYHLVTGEWEWAPAGLPHVAALWPAPRRCSLQPGLLALEAAGPCLPGIPELPCWGLHLAEAFSQAGTVETGHWAWLSLKPLCHQPHGRLLA